MMSCSRLLGAWVSGRADHRAEHSSPNWHIERRAFIADVIFTRDVMIGETMDPRPRPRPTMADHSRNHRDGGSPRTHQTAEVCL